MKKLQPFQKPMLLALLLLVAFSGFSQVTEAWVKQYNGPGNMDDQARSLAVDGSGNVYVTGSSQGNGTGYDFATVKYNAVGNVVWTRRYSGPLERSDGATAVAVDATGNVYVTGSSDGSKFEESFDNHDVTTIKYDAAGNEVWVRHYGTAESDDDGGEGGSDVAVDAAGNIYVTGHTANSYVTIKYDAAGNQLWVKGHNDSMGGGEAFPAALALDGSGNVYVTGTSGEEYGGAENRYTTLKYNTNGTRLWVRNYSTSEFESVMAYALAVDASGNVYVTGDNGTVKYNTAGTQLWTKSDAALSVAVDAAGNAFITGGGSTKKYNAAGTELWVRKHNIITTLGSDMSTAVDAAGSVYITGQSDTYPNVDYSTTKYDAAGTEVWAKTYNGNANSYDAANTLAVDASGNVYVTGSSIGNGTGNDYATIKYLQTTTKQSVSSFTLINADTNKDIRELKEGDTLNLETLSTLNLNIRANTNPATVGSVLFGLSGAEMRNQTENISPYALFADNNSGDYYAWTPKNGNYTLTATPYSAAKGGGTKGTPLTIHFSVTGQVVRSLILVNADTDTDIKTLKNGDVIDLSALPTSNLNIRAVVHPDTVGSVVFNLNNKLIVRENIVPYAIGGDINGDYRPWSLPTGNHVLTATPYQGSFGSGRKGKAHSVSFTVTGMSAITYNSATGSAKPITEISSGGRQDIGATPNPFSGRTMISFSVPKSGYTTVQVYDTKGQVVERLYQAWAEGGKLYQVPFESKGLQSGVYIVRVATNNHRQSGKLVLMR